MFAHSLSIVHVVQGWTAPFELLPPPLELLLPPLLEPPLLELLLLPPAVPVGATIRAGIVADAPAASTGGAAASSPVGDTDASHSLVLTVVLVHPATAPPIRTQALIAPRAPAVIMCFLSLRLARTRLSESGICCSIRPTPQDPPVHHAPT